MAGVGYILIPFDGGRETSLNAAQAKSQQVIDDPVRETRLCELLDQRPAMDNVKFMLTTKGVLMHGTNAQALTMSRLVGDLPNLAPSMKFGSAPQASAAATANDNGADRIKGTFGSAARHVSVAPITGTFTMAARDAASTVRGNRPAINGSYGVRALAA